MHHRLLMRTPLFGIDSILVLRKILIARACVYCTYGPVHSPFELHDFFKREVEVVCTVVLRRGIAPTPTACATALFSLTHDAKVLPFYQTLRKMSILTIM